jgi:putative oxidoreductase
MSGKMTEILSNKWLILAIRLILGVTFILASIDKIANPGGFALSIYNYRMLPHETINLMAIVMPWLELVTGVLIIAGILMRGSAFWLAIMLLVFIIALSSALARGLDISCGCFSVEGGHAVDLGLLIRDILMFIGAVIVMFSRTSALTLRRSPH